MILIEWMDGRRNEETDVLMEKLTDIYQCMRVRSFLNFNCCIILDLKIQRLLYIRQVSARLTHRQAYTMCSNFKDSKWQV